MPTPADFTQVLTDLDGATNDVAAVLQALRDTIKTSMTTEEVNAAKATIQGTVDRLKGLAKNPDEPVPTPEPAFASARRK